MDIVIFLEQLANKAHFNKDAIDNLINTQSNSMKSAILANNTTQIKSIISEQESFSDMCHIFHLN